MQHHCSSMQHKVEVAAKITINWRWQWWQRLEQWWWHGSNTAMQHHHSRLQCKMEVPAKKSRKQSTRVGGDGRQHAVGKYYNLAELSTSSVCIFTITARTRKEKEEGLPQTSAAATTVYQKEQLLLLCQCVFKQSNAVPFGTTLYRRIYMEGIWSNRYNHIGGCCGQWQ